MLQNKKVAAGRDAPYSPAPARVVVVRYKQRSSMFWHA
jgi:hypothetical protein